MTTDNKVLFLVREAKTDIHIAARKSAAATAAATAQLPNISHIAAAATTAATPTSEESSANVNAAAASSETEAFQPLTFGAINSKKKIKDKNV
jgi:fatty acid/phospholipid biosynthesis enzyme